MEFLKSRCCPASGRRSVSCGRPKSAMCGRLRVGKNFLHVAGLVGTAMCSTFAVHITVGHHPGEADTGCSPRYLSAIGRRARQERLAKHRWHQIVKEEQQLGPEPRTISPDVV